MFQTLVIAEYLNIGNRLHQLEKSLLILFLHSTFPKTNRWNDRGKLSLTAHFTTPSLQVSWRPMTLMMASMPRSFTIWCLATPMRTSTSTSYMGSYTRMLCWTGSNVNPTPWWSRLLTTQILLLTLSKRLCMTLKTPHRQLSPLVLKMRMTHHHASSRTCIMLVSLEVLVTELEWSDRKFCLNQTGSLFSSWSQSNPSSHPLKYRKRIMMMCLQGILSWVLAKFLKSL